MKEEEVKINFPIVYTLINLKNSELDSGVYFLQLHTDKWTTTKKFLKK